MRSGLTGVVVAVALLWAAGLPGGPGHAAQVGPRGTILGRVDFARAVAAVERRPEVSSLNAPVRPENPEQPVAVIYLETAPTGAFESRPPVRARIDQRNELFHPRVLAVTAGTRVDFPNNDSTYHNVFSLSSPRRFDLGRYPRGSSRSVVFDRPGIVRVFCDIHSHMSAFVLVFSHPYHAATRADGGYRIDGIPPGTYTVAVWYDGSTRGTRTVTIPPGGGAVELDLLVS